MSASSGADQRPMSTALLATRTGLNSEAAGRVGVGLQPRTGRRSCRKPAPGASFLDALGDMAARQAPPLKAAAVVLG